MVWRGCQYVGGVNENIEMKGKNLGWLTHSVRWPWPYSWPRKNWMESIDLFPDGRMCTVNWSMQKAGDFHQLLEYWRGDVVHHIRVWKWLSCIYHSFERRGKGKERQWKKRKENDESYEGDCFHSFYIKYKITIFTSNRLFVSIPSHHESPNYHVHEPL